MHDPVASAARHGAQAQHPPVVLHRDRGPALLPPPPLLLLLLSRIAMVVRRRPPPPIPPFPLGVVASPPDYDVLGYPRGGVESAVDAAVAVLGGAAVPPTPRCRRRRPAGRGGGDATAGPMARAGRWSVTSRDVRADDIPGVRGGGSPLWLLLHLLLPRPLLLPVDLDRSTTATGCRRRSPHPPPTRAAAAAPPPGNPPPPFVAIAKGGDVIADAADDGGGGGGGGR